MAWILGWGHLWNCYVKIVYKVLGINAPGKASNSSFNTLQLTRNGHKREKKKYRINKRELKNLRKTECTTNRIENTQKFISENITTCNIFTATLRRQQLIYKGEIQTLIKILTERERPNEHEINNKRLGNATPTRKKRRLQKAKVNVIRQINTTINEQKNLILMVTILQCLKSLS